APSMRLTDHLLALFSGRASDDSASASWSIEKLSVRGGKMRVDLAAYPLLEFDFSAQLRDMAVDGGGAADLSLSRFSIREREGEAEALTLSSAHVTATLAGLRNRSIREIEVEDPHVNVTDHLLEWRPPQSTT